MSVDPCDEVLEAQIHGQRTRFVHDPLARRERDDHHGPAMAVRVARAEGELGQRPQCFAAAEFREQLLDITGQVVQELGGAILPVSGCRDEQACEYGILLENALPQVGRPEEAREVGVAGLRGITDERALNARDVQLENRNLERSVHEMGPECRLEQACCALGIERRVRVRLANAPGSREECGEAGGDERLDERSRELGSVRIDVARVVRDRRRIGDRLRSTDGRHPARWWVVVAVSLLWCSDERREFRFRQSVQAKSPLEHLTSIEGPLLAPPLEPARLSYGMLRFG